MKKAKTLILLAFIAISTALSAQQIKIPNSRCTFSFPNGGWKYLQTNQISDDAVVYLYSYSKDYVIDNTGDTVLPFMRIYVKKNFTGTVYDLAYSRFMTQPFQSLDEFLRPDGSFGYWGAYTNEDDGKDYEFLMLYLTDQNTGFEVRIECTRDNYEQFEKDFKDIINTVKIRK